MSLGQTDDRVAVNHVLFAREQLDDVAQTLTLGAYRVDVVERIRAVQRSLERASRDTPHRHLDRCPLAAAVHGHRWLTAAEVADATKFGPALDAARNTRSRTVATTLILPGMASRTCAAAIVRVIAPIEGVGLADVDVFTRSVRIIHDDRATARRLIEAIEEQGYHVSHASVAAEGATIGDRDEHRAPGGSGHDRSMPAATTNACCRDVVNLIAARAGHLFVDGDGI